MEHSPQACADLRSKHQLINGPKPEIRIETPNRECNRILTNRPAFWLELGRTTNKYHLKLAGPGEPASKANAGSVPVLPKSRKVVMARYHKVARSRTTMEYRQLAGQNSDWVSRQCLASAFRISFSSRTVSSTTSSWTWLAANLEFPSEIPLRGQRVA